MSARFLAASAVKDLRRLRRDPLALALWLGIPILLGLMIRVAFGGGSGRAPKAHLLVADQDDSFVSELLVQGLSRVEVIEIESVDEVAGRARVARDAASALLVIPRGFGDAVIDERPTALRLLKNPAQRILPEIVETTLEILVDGTFYAQQLLGAPLRELRAGPAGGASTFSDETIVRISTTLNRLVGRLRGTLLPPVVALETRSEESGGGKATPSIGLLFFPGLLTMSQLFIAAGMCVDVWRELQLGTLRRVLVTPQRPLAFAAGKLAAGALLMLGVGAGAMMLGVALLDVPWRAVPLALLWSTFAGTVFMSLLVLLQVHASSQRAGAVLTNLLVFPLMMVGGSFFPFEAMPAWLAAVGRFTPNGWAVTLLRAILDGAARPAALLAAFAALGSLGTLALLLTTRRLQRGFLGV